MTPLNVFQPATLSLAENKYLLDHLGEPPVVALSYDLPRGVNPNALRPVFERFYEFEELRKHRNYAWAGLDRIKEAVLGFLEWMEVCAEVNRRGGPKHPSMYAYDGMGNSFKGGIGSDSGVVQSRLLNADGDREYFAVDLRRPDGALLPDLAEIAPWMSPKKREGQPADSVLEDWGERDAKGKAKSPHGTITCGICGFASAFQTANRNSYNSARARMGAHLKRQAKTEVQRHRSLYVSWTAVGQAQQAS